MDAKVHTFPSCLGHLEDSLRALALLTFVILNPVFAFAQKTTTQSFTLQYEGRPQTPYSTDGLSFAFPTVGLFIGVSDYGEKAKVTSTPAHALGAAVMYEAFVDAATRSENKALEIPANNYFKGGGDAICALVFSPDGSYFATGSKDGTVKIWSGTGVATDGNKHKANACAEAISPDSSQLVTGGSEGDVVIQWVRGEKAPIILKHPRGLCSVAFGPDGSEILSTALDGITRLWGRNGLQEPLLLSSEQDCPPEKRETQSCADGPAAAFGPDDKTVVTSSCGALRLWSLDKAGESTLLGKEKTTVHSMSFSPDGSMVLSITDDGVSLWPIGNTSRQQQGRRNPSGRNATFSPDGTRIAVGQASGLVKLYRIPAMEEIATLGAFGTGIKSLQFSHNGQYVLVNSKTGSAWMQDLIGARRPTPVPRPDQEGDVGMTIKFAIDHGTIPPVKKTAATEVVAFSPDAGYVVAGYEDGSIGIHPGISMSEQRAFRLDNQLLLGDLKFDKTDTSIMAIWYLAHLHGASKQLIYSGPGDDAEASDDPNWLRLGRGEPVTRERIFAALSNAIQKAEQTAEVQTPALLTVYVAAHGWIANDGRQYFLPSDADSSDPRTWIAYEDFLNPIRNFLTSPTPAGARDYDPHRAAIVIFDTCQTRLGSSQNTPVVSSSQDPINLTVIESTSPGQYAWHWTGKVDSNESTTTYESKSRFGLNHHSGPKDTNTKSEYSARMSMFPYASQWALNALIKAKGSNASVDERRISLGQWIANTQEVVRVLQKDIPEVKETGHVQTVRFRNPKQPDFSIFEVDKNAPPE